jgi:guanylate kinase
VGDFVLYYDLDGGKAEGQVLVGKVTFIQRNVGSPSDEYDGWKLELSQMEDLGEGYFGEYSARQRGSRRALRDLGSVRPLAATFVRTENAYKVNPVDKTTGQPIPRATRYDVVGYEGPFSGVNAIDWTVVEKDAEAYSLQKGQLLRAVAIAGVAGTLVADLVKGEQDAIIYAAGSLASVLYLLLLSVKTDTVATPEAKYGKSIANARWAMPALVLVGIALYNASLGEGNPVRDGGLFDYITAEQYGAAILGFLTYRIPLFLIQIRNAFKDQETGQAVLPGSAGVAMKLISEDKADSASDSTSLASDSLKTVLLVSGPQATGRSDLVRQLIEQGEGKYVAPMRVDRIKDGPEFDRLERREAFLEVDESGRYGLTKEGILKSCQACGRDSVVVIDANVDLAKQVTKISGLRLVSVWVGRESVQEFEQQLETDVERGIVRVSEDETKESVIRGKIRDIIQEIEYGISSGIFEFTILNANQEESLKQLREAASYCFK